MEIDPSKLTGLELIEVNRLQHYAAIGHVAAEWAYFEHVIDSWCLSIGGISVKPGVCLTSQIAGHNRKLDAFIALARLTIPRHRFGDKLDEFCRDANGLAERRNRVVHDHWDTSDILKPRRVEATARRKLRLQFVQVPTSEILELAIQIADLRIRFDDLASKVVSPKPSRNKPRGRQPPEGRTPRPKDKT